MYAFAFFRLYNKSYDLNMVDFNFFYKYSIRFIVFNKLNNILNTYSIPMIIKLVLFFSLVKIDDLDMVQCYNYAYYINFFLEEELFLQNNVLFLIWVSDLILFV